MMKVRILRVALLMLLLWGMGITLNPGWTLAVPPFNSIEGGPGEPEIKPPTDSCTLDSPHLSGIDIMDTDICPRCCTLGYTDLSKDTGFAWGSGAGVYLHSGEFYVYEVDLEIPGRGFNWKFARKYRSRIISNGPLGRSWEFNYIRRLQEEVNGDVMRTDGFGRVDHYVRNPNGSYTAPTGFYTQLIKNPDDTFVERDRTGNTASYRQPDGDGFARLAELRDRNDNRMRFLYNDQNQLERVIDTLGRPIDYFYNEKSLLVEVRDFFDRSITFTYDRENNLIAVTSPTVTGTPNGNDFPQGKTTRYFYTSGFTNDFLKSNMIAIMAPNEVASGEGPRIQVAYDTDSSSTFDQVSSMTIGGTNASGVPAGGTIGYEYEDFEEDVGSDDFVTPVSQTTVTDRNGNVTEYQFNKLGNIVSVREFTNRDVRQGDPEFFETRFEYNKDGELTKSVYPESNVMPYDYDDENPDRFQQGNLLSSTQIPDAERGGDQAFITTTVIYEPIYNRMRTRTEPRGNDPDYMPQNVGVASPERYTTRYFFDYEEGCNFAAIGAKVGRTAAEVEQSLNDAEMCQRPLGDLNGDGNINQVSGNVIQMGYPSVNLLLGSNQAEIEGNTLQPIVKLYQYNRFGQKTKMIDPEKNVNVYRYYPENDPDGDGQDLTEGVSDNPFGYLKEVIFDIGRDPARNSGTDSEPTDISMTYFYDPVGNVVKEIDGRGIATEYFINELNQVVQMIRAADVSEAVNNPEEVQGTPEEMGLVAFRYITNIFFDFNDNVVLRQVEDQGNTSNVDGNPPSADLPLNASNPDPVGGMAFVGTIYKYDILDNPIEMLEEVENGANSEFLRTRYRYDRNENRVLEIQPEGNATSSVFDERDLLFQSTRGAIALPTLIHVNSSVVHNLDVRGGLPSTTTFSYDLNRNLVQVCDAEDTDGSSANNCALTDTDRTTILHDGFDRKVSEIDAVGNQTVYQYDPSDNLVRVSRFGPVGGPSPATDGAATFSQPLSNLWVLQGIDQPLLETTEYRYDELSRQFQIDRVLFISEGVKTVRPPDVADGASDIGKGDLTLDDDDLIPGVNGVNIIGRVTGRSEYDRNSRLTFTVEDDGDTFRTFYDGIDRVIKTLDPEGNVVETAYDNNHNIIEIRETDVSQVDTPDEVFLATNFYDSLDRIQRVVDNIGQTVFFRYDSRNNLVAMADAQGPITGNSIERRAFPEGALTVNEINDFGNVALYFYDGINRKTREERILTASGNGDGQHTGADLFGIKTDTPAPDPNQSADGIIRVGYTYDQNSLLSSLLDDNGNVTLYLYDNLNRQISETKGMTVNTAPLNKVRILGSRNLVTPTVKSINNPATIRADKIDDQLAVAKVRLDAVAALFSSLVDHIDDSPPTTIATGYDRNGNVLIREDESDNEIFTKFDAVNRRTAVRVFRTGQPDTHASDPIFAPTPANDPSNHSTNFLETVGTTKEDYQYDGLSRLIRASDNNEPDAMDNDSVITFSYDSLNRVIEETQKIGDLPVKAISSSWRAENLRSCLIYPNDRTIKYTYDLLDRLDTAADEKADLPIADYNYIGKWRVAERTFPINGTRMTFLNDESNEEIGYDGLRRVVALRHLSPDNTLLVGFTHRYDRMNNKMFEEKLHDSENSELYDYDSIYRVIDFQRGQLNENKTTIETLTTMANVVQRQQWDLDGVGNWSNNVITEENLITSETRLTTSLNEYRSVDEVFQNHDDNGNVVDDGNLILKWDYRNRLKTATLKFSGVNFAQYTYDAINRRIHKVVTHSDSLNGNTTFFYNGWQVIEEDTKPEDEKTSLQRQYVYGNYIDEVLISDSLLSRQNRLFYHQNTQFSIFALTDDAAEIVVTYQYDAYGNPIKSQRSEMDTSSMPSQGMIGSEHSLLDNPYLFTGRRFDAETGLFYFRTRYLDPTRGRFISRDTLGIWGDSSNLGNGYAYVASNPLIGLDPLGQKYTIDERNKKIKACLELYKANEDDEIDLEALGKKWKEGIEKVWKGKDSEGTEWAVEVEIKTRKKCDPPNENCAQIEVKKGPDTSTNTIGGRDKKVSGWWDDKDTGNVAAHEFGHSLGLGDEYSGNPTVNGLTEEEAKESIMTKTSGNPKVYPEYFDKITEQQIREFAG